MKCVSTTFSGHALQRMFSRNIEIADIKKVLEDYELIAEYPEDRPYPSRLILGWVNMRPLHVVASQNTQDYACYIITAYIPSLELWLEDFKTRRTL